ncbi:hypothetical protein SAMN05216224_102209 [Thioclava dalianensis]|nr:hypothetical protein SAMN05216224_102209 [Thioclava dalianensis]
MPFRIAPIIAQTRRPERALAICSVSHSLPEIGPAWANTMSSVTSVCPSSRRHRRLTVGTAVAGKRTPSATSASSSLRVAPIALQSSRTPIQYGISARRGEYRSASKVFLFAGRVSVGDSPPASIRTASSLVAQMPVSCSAEAIECSRRRGSSLPSTTSPAAKGHVFRMRSRRRSRNGARPAS